MNRNIKHERDLLYYNLPAVFNSGKYLIFSPYALKIAEIDQDFINSDEMKNELEKDGFFGEPQKPDLSSDTTEIGLILTTDCNLNCNYCYLMSQENKLYISSDIAIKAIKEFIRPNTKRLSISFFGGEPTLNMRIIKLVVEYVKSYPIQHRFIINSNGTFTKKDLEFMLSNGFIFSISTDGPPEINDMCRLSVDGKSVSKIVENNVKKIVEANGLLQVRATITKENINYMNMCIDYWHNIGVSFIHIEPVNQIGLISKNYLRPDPEEYIDQLKLMIDATEHRKIYFISSPFMNLLTPSTNFCCTIAGEKTLFTPDGYVSSCYRIQSIDYNLACYFIIGEYNYGNNKFHYYNDKIRDLKNTASYLNNKCLQCFARYICAGGCPIKSIVKKGDFDEWNCHVKNELIKDSIVRIKKYIVNNVFPSLFGQSIFESYAAERFEYEK